MHERIGMLRAIGAVRPARSGRAAAQASLNQEYFDLFTVILSGFVQPQMKQRDRLAHWCWGYSDHLPDDILLLDPDYKRANVATMLLELPGEDPFNRDGIDVVKEQDVIEILNRLRISREHVGRFIGTIWPRTPRPQRAEFLRKLSNEPPIQEALVRLRQRRQNSAPP